MAMCIPHIGYWLDAGQPCYTFVIGAVNSPRQMSHARSIQSVRLAIRFYIYKIQPSEPNFGNARLRFRLPFAEPT
jgi:hypothetical protein